MQSKILVVDDDPGCRELLMYILVDAGFAVVVAEDGQCALKNLTHSSDIDAVVSDVLMPNMDGIQLLELVGTKFPMIPVLLMSGGIFDDASMKKIGSAARFFEKPIEVDDLIKVLRDTLH